MTNEAAAMVSECGCEFTSPNEETDANARLIAAAPDLLAALRDALTIADDWLGDAEALTPERIHAFGAAARAAIRKATGG